jgi:hypothetical protein
MMQEDGKDNPKPQNLPESERLMWKVTSRLWNQSLPKSRPIPSSLRSQFPQQK